jgi:hypothetical protein
MAQLVQVAEVKRGSLVSRGRLWFILPQGKKEEDGLIPLPDHLKPLKVIHRRCKGVVSFRSGTSNNRRFERRYGMKVLYQDQVKRDERQVVAWGVCPNRLRNQKAFPSIMIAEGGREWEQLRTRFPFPGRMVG